MTSEPAIGILAARGQHRSGRHPRGGGVGAGHRRAQVQPPVQVPGRFEGPANHRRVVVEHRDTFGATLVDAGDYGMLC